MVKFDLSGDGGSLGYSEPVGGEGSSSISGALSLADTGSGIGASEPRERVSCWHSAELLLIFAYQRREGG